MRKFFKRLIGILSVVLFIVCLVIFVFVIIYASSHDGVPMIGSYGLVNIKTESMVPKYNVGDILLIKKIRCEDIKAGDVISFYSSDPAIYGMPNTHRVVALTKEGNKVLFTTKGDNNPAEDIYKVEYSAVIGKAEKKIPSVGKIIAYLQNNGAVFFIVIILPLIILTFFEIRNVYLRAKEVEKENEEKRKGD